MMGEPLFDGVSAAIVLFGLISVLALRASVVDAEIIQRARKFDLAGHVLLGIAVSLLLFRWIDAVTDLSLEARPSFWRSGSLSTTCGIGLIAALKAVIAGTIARRVQYFVITAVSAVISLAIASAWDWALLVLAMLCSGLAVAQWCTTRNRISDDSLDDVESPREPVLVLGISAMVVLLLLGTWEHVITNEAQRKTRSSRYSAWPRATALRNAWERTGWSARTADDNSTQQVEDVAAREQWIALGLGSLLLVVAATACFRTRHAPTTLETDHAG